MNGASATSARVFSSPANFTTQQQTCKVCAARHFSRPPPGRPQSRARSQQPTSTPWHPPKVDNGRSDPISFWMPSSAQVTVRTNLQPGHMIDSKRLIDASCARWRRFAARRTNQPDGMHIHTVAELMLSLWTVSVRASASTTSPPCNAIRTYVVSVAEGATPQERWAAAEPRRRYLRQ